MVDLYGQFKKIEHEVNNAIQEVIHSSAFIKGPEVKKFEKELGEYIGCKHVIACGNGTDALQIALMSLDLEPGDEVITPDFTFIATVEVNALLGLKPVLVDVEPDTFTIDPSKVEESITEKTKALIPVHLFGQCAAMDELLKIAKKYNLYIIEDVAQALGAIYRFDDGTVLKAGNIGEIGCTSFFPSKNLGAFGDGGAVFTNNDELAEKIRSIANHGMKVKYVHDYIGINSRLDTLQAAILRVKLKHLDEYNKAREMAANWYDKHLQVDDQILTPYRNPDSTHIFHQYTLKILGDKRDALREKLSKQGIPTMVYYPLPMHKQEIYKQSYDMEDRFKITNHLCKEVLSLPMHTELNEEDVKHIADQVIKYFNL